MLRRVSFLSSSLSICMRLSSSAASAGSSKVDATSFAKALEDRDVGIYAGVPDSLLKDFCLYLEQRQSPIKHVICANEGAAVGTAAGYHLATGKYGVVYLQNSGLGNCVNPLLSMAHKDVYSIPMLLLIGWRGEPGVKDEPQHGVQGRMTPEMLTTMNIPHSVVPFTNDGVEAELDKAHRHMRNHSTPYALVVRKDTFVPFSGGKMREGSSLVREPVLQSVLNSLTPSDVIIGTTGFTSRELYELRKARNEGHGQDFLTVGSMGYASSLALGVAFGQPDRLVVCLDGDGAMIMHMGSLATIGNLSPTNLRHIVLNNGAHESVGGQPAASSTMDIPAIAKACGYRTVMMADSEPSLRAALAALRHAPGPALLEIKIAQGARKNLGRPSTSPLENKAAFMAFLGARH